MRFAAMGSRFCSKDTLRGRGQSGYFGSRRVLSDLCAPVVSSTAAALAADPKSNLRAALRLRPF